MPPPAWHPRGERTKKNWTKSVVTETKKRRWLRLAFVVALVGVVLAIGKAVPLPGISMQGLSDMIAVCTGGLVHGTWGVQCVLPKPMHLAAAEHVWMWGGALALFVILWLRLRLTAKSHTET